jgi:hypothetical protein
MINKLNYGKVNGDSEELHALKGFKVLAVGNGTIGEGLDGIMYRTYKLLRGSSTYDPSEMARLIDGLITSCKEAGLAASEIATPDEKRLLKERYGVDIG